MDQDEMKKRKEGLVKEEWKVSREQLCYILQRDVFNINVDEV